MPELPEVETVRRALARLLVARRITGVAGKRVRLRRPMDPARLDRRIRGRSVAEPRRRGKYLLIDFDPPGTLLVHLGMSGRLLLVGAEAPVPPHTHLVLDLDDGSQLRLVDPRRFGLVQWLDPGQEAREPSLRLLGAEPLDQSLAEVLPAELHARRAPLKSLLLDQRVLAGVGNIYATEALWRAGIRPSRRGHRTSLDRLERLAREVQAVLFEAIEQGGTTIRDFASPEGDFGSFAVRLQVYGRNGAPCPRCRGGLHDLRIGNRSTVWCPRCQT